MQYQLKKDHNLTTEKMKDILKTEFPGMYVKGKKIKYGIQLAKGKFVMMNFWIKKKDNEEYLDIEGTAGYFYLILIILIWGFLLLV